MVEVFKTHVVNIDHAKLLVDQIHNSFDGYKANFDLDDCDKILRIECESESVDVLMVIDLLSSYGFSVNVLEDSIPSGSHDFFENDNKKTVENL